MQYFAVKNCRKTLSRFETSKFQIHQQTTFWSKSRKKITVFFQCLYSKVRIIISFILLYTIFCPSLVIQCFCWMWILMLGILCNYFDLLLWTLQMDHYLLKQTTYKLYVWINLVINCLQLVMVVTTKSTIFARGLFI